MKKSVLVLFVLMLSLSFAAAAVGDACTENSNCSSGEVCTSDVCVEETTTDTTVVDDLTQVDKAYACLNQQIADQGCSALSLEEKTFSLLATGDCKSELTSESQDSACWPKASCTIKATAQALLALDQSGSSTTNAKDWLLSKTAIPEDVVWYLQIESSAATSCSVTYGGTPYTISIAEDKKISAAAGSCLSLSEGAYWLRVSPSCYDETFEVSCDQGFATNLLFKKKTSSTINVLEATHSQAAEGRTEEKVNAECFSTTAECDYEGSLWAAMVLEQIGEDTSSYLLYLVTMADENQKLLPDSFLYFLTSYQDFRTNILLSQKANQYWEESGDKFFDTALALWHFTDDPQEKTNSKEWLLEVQDSSGCWKGDNIRDTAFVLTSIWPRGGTTTTTTTDIDCLDAGYFCTSRADCDEAQIFDTHSCAGTKVCCETEFVLPLCEDINGDICNSNQKCVGGTDASASDTDFGEVCCVGGTCQDIADEPECEQQGGTCRSSCLSDEQENEDDCDDSGDVCCEDVTTPTKDGISIWIWILGLLIILVIIGIVFRNKLRPIWMRTKSKLGKSKSGPSSGSSPRRPGFPPGPSSGIPIMGAPRRMLPPNQQRRPLRRPLRKPQGEMDDVLKKLKGMGK